jgi:prolycopene isomerase
MNIVIIGSGMAGLVAAATLSRRGHKVTVLEQFPTPGGVTAPFEQDGFRWDLGQLLVEGFGPGEPTGEIFADLGIADQVRLKKDDRRYVFPDFEINKPEQFGGIHWRMHRLAEIFPGEVKGLGRYWNDALRFTRIMAMLRKLNKATGLAKTITNLRLYATLLPFLSRQAWSAQQVMDDYFTDNRLKMVFISILADFFTPPSQFLGLGVFALNSEASFDSRQPKSLASGAEQLYHWSVLGGIHTVVDALITQIQAAGGIIRCATPVKTIRIQDGRAVGVETASGEFIPAETVIASGAAREAFTNLVGSQNLPPEWVKQVEELPLMDSVFMVHLGLNYDPTPSNHGTCTYYYGTYELEEGIQKAKSGVYHEGDAGFVVHIPTAHSPEMAPAGHHSLTIYTICPDRLAEGGWAERKDAMADKLVSLTERYIPGLRAHTVTRAVITPDDWRARVYASHHSFGGMAPYKGISGIPYQTPVKNLWYIGSQSQSGAGLGNVITGAYKTALQVDAD